MTITRAFLVLFFCAAGSASADTFMERWRTALRKETVPGLDEFDPAGRELSRRGISSTLAMGSSMAQFDLQFGGSVQFEIPPAAAYAIGPRRTARFLLSAFELALPPRKNPLLNELHCLRLPLLVSGGCPWNSGVSLE